MKLNEVTNPKAQEFMGQCLKIVAFFHRARYTHEVYSRLPAAGVLTIQFRELISPVIKIMAYNKIITYTKLYQFIDNLYLIVRGRQPDDNITALTLREIEPDIKQVLRYCKQMLDLCMIDAVDTGTYSFCQDGLRKCEDVKRNFEQIKAVYEVN